MIQIGKVTAIVLAALVSWATASSAAQARENWTATVSVSAEGQHVLGNPKAPVQLTEYVSYTCPHCSTFQKQAEAPMRLAYVMPGKLSVKVHHFIRDPVDLTITMLTNCGDPQGFFKLHHTFLYGQDKWLTKMGDFSEAQRLRWRSGKLSERTQAVARDFDFYAIMAQHGMSRTQVDRCLSDVALATRLAEQSRIARDAGVDDAPRFALGGTILAATEDWETLDLQIKARM